MGGLRLGFFIVDGSCYFKKATGRSALASSLMTISRSLSLTHAVALYFMYYNFTRIHETIRCTPAMEAGVCDYLWSIQEIVGLADREK